MKTNILKTTVIFIILTGLFFLFQFVGKQKNIVKQLDNTKIENIQNDVPTKSETASNDKTEHEKKLPSAIPIFMYHYIRDFSNSSDPIGKNLSVSPEKFEEQLSWLEQNSYQTVFPNFFNNPQPVSFKPVILTFDDGYQDAYDFAFPILKKYKMSGTFYLIADKIGSSGYLTWDEIGEMQNAGMSFGSHTLSHPDLRNLSEINLENEIKGSRERLEQKLGAKITDFCYPSGKYNDDVLKKVRFSGYETAVSTNSGISDLKYDHYQLKRLRIEQNTNIQGILP